MDIIHFRFMFSKTYITLGSADRGSFIQAMKSRESLVLVPGGLHEATLTSYGKEQLYIQSRKGNKKMKTKLVHQFFFWFFLDYLLISAGFIRYSLQHGYSLTPVYAFGENMCYNHFLSGVLHDIKFWLNSKGIPTVIPFGFLYWPFGFLPYRYVR